MGWDEALFGWFYRKVRGLTSAAPDPASLARSASLDELRDRLALVAAALAGHRLTVRASESLGGADGEALLLPARIDLAPDPEGNARVYLHRVVCGVACARGGWFLPRTMSPEEALARTALAMPDVWREADATLPGFDPLRREVAAWELARRPDPATLSPRGRALEALVRAVLRGDDAPREPALERLLALSASGPACPPLASWGLLLPRASPSSKSARGAPEPASALPSGTERKGRSRDALRRVEMGRDRIDENPLTHSFEKVHTAEEYKGGRKAVDGSDEMGAHGEALDELDLREVIRSPETTRSLYRADLLLDGAAGDLEDDARPDDRVVTYREWSCADRAWREGWCSVRESMGRVTVTRPQAAAWVRGVLHRHRAEVRALRAEFERIEHGRAWRTRQPDGPDVDLDALVDRHAALRAGHSPPDRLYVARRRHAPEVATLVLLDASLSSDAWVAGRRVLDVARDSVVVLGEALSGLHDELAVASFHSNTRRDCRFEVLEPMGGPRPRAWARLASVEPAGYTRIGPALRHATASLARARARRRLLLVVTDGRPTDYDRYEGRYGIEDVAMAAREAHDAGVTLFALAIDAKARGHLEEMFGRGRYAVLPRPEALVDAMAGVYGRALGR